MTAYGCQPDSGSENFLGWSWVAAMASLPEVELTVLTSARNATAIEAGPTLDCRFHFVSDEAAMPEILPGQLDEVVRYLAFNRRAQRLIRTLGAEFDLAHHVSWTNIRTKSPAFAAGCPVVLGPVGGGQLFPWRFMAGLRPFHAALEAARNLQVLTSPLGSSTRRQISSASLVVASNKETFAFAERLGARSVALMPDVPSLGSQPTGPRWQSIGRFELIWVGRLLPRKGLPLAIAAVVEAAKRIDVRLTVVGEGVDGRLLDGLPEENFRVLGQVRRSDLDALYQESHALLYTSLRDSGGPPLAEAMSFGLPAVLIDHQGPELLGRGWTIGVPLVGYDGTVAGLADGIVELARNDTLYEQLADEAVRSAERSSSVARAQVALSWYSNALGRPLGPSES